MAEASSSDEGAVGHGFGSSGAMDEARDHGLEVVAPVVAPGKAGEVALDMIGAEFAVGPGDRALDVAERRIDPVERGHTSSLGSQASADRTMGVSALAEHTPTTEAVADDRASWSHPMHSTARDRALAEAPDRRQLELARAPHAASRDCGDEGRLARRAAPTLPARAPAAEIGIVHLHPTREPLLPLAPGHHRHDLVLHGPGRRLLDITLIRPLMTAIRYLPDGYTRMSAIELHPSLTVNGRWRDSFSLW